MDAEKSASIFCGYGKLKVYLAVQSGATGDPLLCHCEERSDVAIPRYNYSAIWVLK